MADFIFSNDIDDPLILKSALLIYRNNSRGVILKADIQESENGLILKGTHNITEDLSNSLLQESGQNNLKFLDSHILAQNHNSCIWFVPAQKRILYFNASESINTLSGKSFMQPPLVFKVKGKQLSVYALQENTRPTLTTQLYKAPYWNTSESVCMGNSILPETLDTAAWEASFYQSNFTHLSGPQRWTTQFTHLELWQEVKKAGEFRAEWLIPLDYTLERLLK